MKKYVLKMLILALFLTLSAFSKEEPIKASINYTEATARIEAFSGTDLKIDRAFFKDHLKDKNKKENLQAISKNQFLIDSRGLYPFYIKNSLMSYSINYYETPEYVYYYNILGSLIKFEIKKGDDYPKKSIGYSRNGNLISVAFEVSEKEQFIYDEKGRLIAHWVNNKVMNDTKTNKLLNKMDFKRGY